MVQKCIAEKQQKAILNFSLDKVIVIESHKQWNIKKILILWEEEGDSNCVIRKQNIVIYDQSSGIYDAGNETIYNIEVWKSNLCDYNDVYILVKRDTTVMAVHATQLAFKNYAPLLSVSQKLIKQQ